MWVCKQSGYKAGEYCVEKEEQLVPPAGEKTSVCPYHKLVHLDRTATFRVTDACEHTGDMVHQPWFILPPAMEYYYRVKHSDYRPLPPFMAGCGDEGGNNVMEMLYPKNNAAIYVPLEIDGKRGNVVFTATHRNEAAEIYWHLDNEYVATTKHNHQLALSPPPGKHTLTLVDNKGERLVQQFVILDKGKP